MPTAVVYLGLFDDATVDWPGRNQLFKAMTSSRPLVFLERASATRRLVDLRRPTIEQVGPNFFVMRTALALRTHRLGRRVPRLAALIDGRWFRRTLDSVGLGDHIVWMTQPDPILALGVPDERLVYDCMDPNFLPERQEAFDQAEFALARRAALVFASARTLFERMRAVNPRTHLLPNAAPTAVPTASTPSRPEVLPDGPVVGYLGTIDWRFDAEHVLAAAQALPEVTFAIVGRVNADQEAKIASLRKMRNVLFPGQVSNEVGDAFVAAFDVGLIPFTPGEMNDAISPVKMFMYLNAGLPVVSTWVAECRENPLVAAARSPEEFADLTRQAVSEQDPAATQARRDFGAANTWTHRAASAVEVLRHAGLVR